MKNNIWLGGLFIGLGMGFIIGGVAIRSLDSNVVGTSVSVVSAQIEECELPLRRNEFCEVIVVAVPNTVAAELRVALDDLKNQPTPEPTKSKE